MTSSTRNFVRAGIRRQVADTALTNTTIATIRPCTIGSTSASAQCHSYMVRDERREVRERKQVPGHDQRIAPGVRFALHDGQRREALGREDVPGEQGEGSCQT